MLYLLTAGKKALADGGITDEVMNVLDKTKCGVLIGSAMGGMKVQYFILFDLKAAIMLIKRLFELTFGALVTSDDQLMISQISWKFHR